MSVSGNQPVAEGITNPPIDDLLTKTDSKYKLVLYSAKRARQINAYYSQLGEGLLEYVGPLVDTHVQEKPLSIALREINDDLLTCEDIDPEEVAAEALAASAAASRRPRRPNRPSSDAGGDLQAMVNGESRPRVVLGVSGGIAAYKACELLRRFTESGHDVTVVPTAAALEFVGAPTWAALSGKPVSTDVWADVHEVPHVRIGQQAELLVVAPATADLLAKAAHGLADDLLTNTLLTARCPVLFAPAMHTEMWEHPATQANVATLRSRGADRARARRGPADRRRHRQGPAARPVARSSPSPPTSSPAATSTAARPPRTSPGSRVVVSAGGTREYLDPVRFIGNRSSGLQGYALARTAAARGAEVTLVAANVSLPDPAGVKVVRVETTAQLQERVLEACAAADAVVMAAAPADFRPDQHGGRPRSRSPTTAAARTSGSPRTPTSSPASPTSGPTTTSSSSGSPPRPATSSGSVMDHARAKLARKGCDLLVVNDVGGGAVFGSEDNEAVVLASDGSAVERPVGIQGRARPRHLGPRPRHPRPGPQTHRETCRDAQESQIGCWRPLDLARRTSPPPARPTVQE